MNDFAKRRRAAIYRVKNYEKIKARLIAKLQFILSNRVADLNLVHAVPMPKKKKRK